MTSVGVARHDTWPVESAPQPWSGACSAAISPGDDGCAAVADADAGMDDVAIPIRSPTSWTAVPRFLPEQQPRKTVAGSEHTPHQQQTVQVRDGLRTGGGRSGTSGMPP